MRVRGGCAVAALVVVSLLVSGCTSRSARPPVSLPVPKAGEVTFYLSLPSSTAGLAQAAARVTTPGSSEYRHFSSPDKAARRFGASDAQINTVAKSVSTLGLGFAADPTRLFGRVTGSAQQWQTALGTPLAKQAATASSPFITYSLPAQTPAGLQPAGTSLLLPQTLVYDPGAEGSRPPSGMRPTPGAASTATPTKAARPFPANTGTPLVAGCSAPLLAQRRVYTQQQVQTAYGIDTLRAHTSGTPVITVLDLGGGWLPNDLKLAGQCFGYSPPSITQRQGDGVATAIAHADDETSLDLQTAAAVAPTAQVRLVQTTLSGLLDGFSRALGDDGAGRRVLVGGGGRCRVDHLWDQRGWDHAVLSGGVAVCHRGRRHPAHPWPRQHPRRRDGVERLGVRRQRGRWRRRGPPAAAAGLPGRRQPPRPPRGPRRQRAGRRRARLARRDQLHAADRRWDQRLDPVCRRGHRAGERLGAPGRPSPGRAGQRLVLQGRVAAIGLLRRHPGQQRPRRGRLLPGRRRLRPRQRAGRTQLGHPARRAPQARLNPLPKPG